MSCEGVKFVLNTKEMDCALSDNPLSESHDVKSDVGAFLRRNKLAKALAPWPRLKSSSAKNGISGLLVVSAGFVFPMETIYVSPELLVGAGLVQVFSAKSAKLDWHAEAMELYAAAQEAYHTGLMLLALPKAKKLLRFQSKNPVFLCLLGSIQARLEMRAEAIETFRSCQKQYPEFAKTYVRLAGLLYDMEQWKTGLVTLYNGDEVFSTRLGPKLFQLGREFTIKLEGRLQAPANVGKVWNRPEMHFPVFCIIFDALRVWDLVRMAQVCVRWNELWIRYRTQRWGELWKHNLLTEMDVCSFTVSGVLRSDDTGFQQYPPFRYLKAEWIEAPQAVFDRFVAYLESLGHGADVDRRFPFLMRRSFGRRSFANAPHYESSLPYGNLHTYASTLSAMSTAIGSKDEFVLVPVGVSWCEHCLLPAITVGEECSIPVHTGVLRDIGYYVKRWNAPEFSGAKWVALKKQYDMSNQTWKGEAWSCCGTYFDCHQVRNVSRKQLYNGCFTTSHSFSEYRSRFRLVKVGKNAIDASAHSFITELRMQPKVKEWDKQPFDKMENLVAKQRRR